jgi:uncharacterized protein (DUF1778 family)
MTNVKTEQLGLRITPTAKALVKAAAESEHRSVSNMVEHLILTYCKEHSIVVSGIESKKVTGKKA